MNAPPLARLAVVISGRGRNLKALHAAIVDGLIPATIVAVISNRADAEGLSFAREARLPTFVVPHVDYPDRAAFDAALADTLRGVQPDIVVLAGFMRILTEGFVRAFEGRMLNIHPSLLPRHKGLHTHASALREGDAEHGELLRVPAADDVDARPPMSHMVDGGDGLGGEGGGRDQQEQQRHSLPPVGRVGRASGRGGGRGMLIVCVVAKALSPEISRPPPRTPPHRGGGEAPECHRRRGGGSSGSLPLCGEGGSAAGRDGWGACNPPPALSPHPVRCAAHPPHQGEGENG